LTTIWWLRIPSPKKHHMSESSTGTVNSLWTHFIRISNPQVTPNRTY
jgi:hypothetical protein